MRRRPPHSTSYRMDSDTSSVMNASIRIEPFAVETRHDVPVKRHSKLGLLSVLIAVGFPFSVIMVLVILLILQDHIENWAFVAFVAILAASIAGVAAHLTGLIIGIAGVARKETRKVLSVLGIVFNAMPLVLSSIACILFLAFLLHPFPLGPK